jgi:hypothetical protein
MSTPKENLKLMIVETKQKNIEREIKTKEAIIAHLERKYKALLSSKSKEDVEQRHAILNEIKQHEKFIKDNTIQPTPAKFADSLPDPIRPMDRIGSASSIEKKRNERVEKMQKEVQDAIKKGHITEKKAVEVRRPFLETINKEMNEDLESLKRRKIVEEEDPTKAKRIEFLKNRLTEINTTIKKLEAEISKSLEEEGSMSLEEERSKSLEEERSKSKTGTFNFLRRGVKGLRNITGMRESSESKQRANINRLRSEARANINRLRSEAYDIRDELEIPHRKIGGRKTKKRRRKTKKGRRKTRNCKP